MRLKSCFLLFAAIITAILLAGFSARAEEDRKYPVLSAYIYNFTQFTTWPAAAMKDAFTVCVVGKDPFGSALEPMKNRTVNGKKISIKRSRREGDLTACNIVFIPGSEEGDVKTILAGLQGAPVLTMSEVDGFSDAGGMVEFRPVNGKIGIWINLAAVRATGISISSKLLSLANVRG